VFNGLFRCCLLGNIVLNSVQILALHLLLKKLFLFLVEDVATQEVLVHVFDVSCQDLVLLGVVRIPVLLADSKHSTNFQKIVPVLLGYRPTRVQNDLKACSQFDLCRLDLQPLWPFIVQVDDSISLWQMDHQLFVNLLLLTITLQTLSLQLVENLLRALIVIALDFLVFFLLQRSHNRNSNFYSIITLSVICRSFAIGFHFEELRLRRLFLLCCLKFRLKHPVIWILSSHPLSCCRSNIFIRLLQTTFSCQTSISHAALAGFLEPREVELLRCVTLDEFTLLLGLVFLGRGSLVWVDHDDLHLFSDQEWSV